MCVCVQRKGEIESVCSERKRQCVCVEKRRDRVCVCSEIETEGEFVEIECQCIERWRVFVCIEIERGVCRERRRGPVTVRVWPRIGVRVRVSCILFSGILSVHAFWHFVRIP